MQSRSPTADEVQTLIDAVELTPGPPGLSAYEVAVVNGFNGDEAAFIASLKGNPGEDAEPAAPGASAYQIAVAQGFVGTVNEWLASLRGPAGDSAYQVALSDGFVGTKTEWLASLKGDPGTGGGGGTGAAAPIFEARYDGPDVEAAAGDYTAVSLDAITRFPAGDPLDPIDGEPRLSGGLVRMTPGFYDITGVVEFAAGSPTMQIMFYPYGADPSDDRINPAAVGAINPAIYGGYAKGSFSGSFRVTIAGTYMLLVFDTAVYTVKSARLRIQRSDQAGAAGGGGGGSSVESVKSADPTFKQETIGSGNAYYMGLPEAETPDQILVSSEYGTLFRWKEIDVVYFDPETLATENIRRMAWSPMTPDVANGGGQNYRYAPIFVGVGDTSATGAAVSFQGGVEGEDFSFDPNYPQYLTLKNAKRWKLWVQVLVEGGGRSDGTDYAEIWVESAAPGSSNADASAWARRDYLERELAKLPRVANQIVGIAGLIRGVVNQNFDPVTGDFVEVPQLTRLSVHYRSRDASVSIGGLILETVTPYENR